MTDRISLGGMVFFGRHGVSDQERAEPQQIEVDLSVTADLHTAGTTDDLERTVDYGKLFEICRTVVEERSFHLLEAIAEQIASDVLARHPGVDAVHVTVRKPGTPIEGELDYAQIEIERSR